MTTEKALDAIEQYIRGSISVNAKAEALAWLALTELKDRSCLEWHETFEDDPSTFPSDDRHVLVSFSNFSGPMIGRWQVDDDGGGAWYVGDMDETFLPDLYVDGWWELPKKPEDKS